ncbi:MAG: NAD-dependent epimerase/dehydratase family protein, partial [Deltaproteobacteria bacterium]|nr:NAD-dependent epimerase/dehydratase family protein [Deltaproteobacteria bacterium]
MTERKRILVTGGAGFIGSHLADAFVQHGHEVAVVDNLSSGRREQVPAAAQFFPYDIKSPETFDLICRWQPQVLVHHAAQMSVRISVDDPVMDAQENILGSLNLFQAAARVKAEKIIFASTGGAM